MTTTTSTTTIMISSSFASETHRWMLASVDRRVDTFPAAILYSLNQRQRVALCIEKLVPHYLD